ncbi:hypothetical protein AcW1_010352 [Taiwanofungus camphoratus]|nr:hypothetical protein AcW2_007436 [Antrodia cinnamomea]KAI0927161.1 hypothetical protein AcV5_007769 [Antrodia cinnamomea]KAI0947235.1 hypothetical protein AcV7_009707 [Antrodia cinnamomea]KAI0953236.1 hypothetical protein AcW1_010352 [Antrodia cinnamomea]
MDESSTYLQSEDSVLCKRPPRIHTTSFSSQASAYSLPHNRQPSRLKSPIPHAPLSPTSVISNGSESEILAPIPQRHYTLQASESRYWLGSPTLSAASSRPVSPLSLPANATSPQQKSQRRLSHQLSFSALMDQEPRGGSHYAHATHALPSGERKVEAMGGLGKRWVRWMHKQGMKYLVIPSTVLASVWVKWIVGLGSYSGQGTPPLFGDYEAQRHWMELTLHLPFTEWYTYDLQYWGLDYPPLTAYVSWLCGVVGSWMEPSWFTLDTSRGLESPSSKTYMRSTVLAFDTLIYVPALVMFVRTWQASRSARTQELAILALILQPALLLIDFGHFQYNSVMLGLTLLALNFFATGHDLIGAVFFVFSLGFKQMALYYAPAVGSYLLGKCLYLGPVAGPRHFIRLALVTIASFLLLFLPFLPPFATPRAIFAPITRIFPFNRGLFEDKVANFWCATDVLVKWRRWATQGALVKLSAALTAAGFLPGVIGLLYGGYKMRAAERTPSTKLNAPKATQDSRKLASAPAPTLGLLPYALLTSAMSFFLFSFQVHEKTILLPLLPLSLLFSGSVSSVDSVTFELGTLVNNVAIFRWVFKWTQKGCKCKC